MQIVFPSRSCPNRWAKALARPPLVKRRPERARAGPRCGSPSARGAGRRDLGFTELPVIHRVTPRGQGWGKCSRKPPWKVGKLEVWVFFWMNL